MEIPLTTYTMIHFNSPDHVNERANVEPLNSEDMHNAGVVLNTLIANATYNPFDFEIELLQRIIWEYENLKHFRDITLQIVENFEAAKNLKFEIQALKLEKKIQEDALNQPKWISVDDALPEIRTDGFSTQVLVTNGKALGINYINKITLNGIKIYGITHWMPLPNPPKTK